MNEQICQPRRALGRTGFVATPLGIGDLADRRVPFETCVETVRRAIDAGLNLVDTSPRYEHGYGETVVGKAVKGVREKLFVIDKIDTHEGQITRQLESSLKRLELDHTDAFVFHMLSSMRTWQAITAPGKSMDELAACVKAGKTRWRGISSHSPEVLRAAILSGLCDLVMFPVGPFVDDRYVTDILPLAKQHKVGTVCFKTFGGGKLLGDLGLREEPLTLRPRGKTSSGGNDSRVTKLPRMGVEECLHYTLTLDPDVALLGLSFPNEQDAAWAAMKAWRGPKDSAWMADVKQRAAIARKKKGGCWWNPDRNA